MRLKVSSCGKFLTAVFLFTTLLSSQNLRADGKMFPEIAYKIPPKIPSQKAIIVYKDGIEKLIIESSLDGQGKEFGWVIPLPAEPNNFEKVSPGLIKTLSLAIQPEITHDLTQPLFSAVWIMICAFLIYLVHLRSSKNKILNVFLLLLIIFVMLSILMPTLGSKSEIASLSEGVDIKKQVNIGNYELFVLKAENPDALDTWLKDNGFLTLDKSDKTIVSDYIKEGWCFVAAKLKRDSDSGFSQPHPLAMSFTSKKPVYPMRLTSTVGNDIYLEIFVISDKQAFTGQLKLEFSDKFKFNEKAYEIFTDKSYYFPGYTSDKFEQEIGHPDSLNLLWDGCVLTKLYGTLKPAQMKSDVILNFRQAKPFQKHYWSIQGAYQYSIILILLAFTSLFIVLHNGYRKNRKLKVEQPFLRAAVISLIASLALGGVLYLVLPKIYNIRTGSFFSKRIYNHEITIFKEFFLEDISIKNIDYRNIKIEDYKKLIEEYISALPKLPMGQMNPFTGQMIKDEDSPGNYVLIKDERGIVWRSFTMEGFPLDFVLKPKESVKDSNSK